MTNLNTHSRPTILSQWRIALCAVACLLIIAVPAQADPAATDSALNNSGIAVTDMSVGDASVSSDDASAMPPGSMVRRRSADREAASNSRAKSGNGAGVKVRSPLTTGDVVLTVVLAVCVIAVLIWIRRRNVGVRPKSRAVMEVLSRTMITPKQSVCLVKVGKRVLVVGAGADNLTTLSEICDPDEVAELVGEIQTAKSSKVAAQFGDLLRSASGQFSVAREVETGVERVERVGREESVDSRGRRGAQQSVPKAAKKTAGQASGSVTPAGNTAVGAVDTDDIDGADSVGDHSQVQQLIKRLQAYSSRASA